VSEYSRTVDGKEMKKRGYRERESVLAALNGTKAKTEEKDKPQSAMTSEGERR